MNLQQFLDLTFMPFVDRVCADVDASVVFNYKAAVAGLVVDPSSASVTNDAAFWLRRMPPSVTERLADGTRQMLGLVSSALVTDAQVQELTARLAAI